MSHPIDNRLNYEFNIFIINRQRTQKLYVWSQLSVVGIWNSLLEYTLQQVSQLFSDMI